MNILIFVKSNSKLHFFGPFSRYVRTLIINISWSKVPTNKVHIHSVRNVCKLVIIVHLSWQDLSPNVDHPFKTRRSAYAFKQMAPNSNIPFISRMRRQNAHMLRRRCRRRRRAYAPTSNTASHGTHEKIISWVPFSSLIWVWGSAWRPSAAGAPLLHGGEKIWILCSSGRKSISPRSLVRCSCHEKIKFIIFELTCNVLFIIAFDKGERLHSALAFENFGAFIDTDWAPQRIPQGRNYSGKWRNFHRPCAQPRSQALSSLSPERGFHVLCFYQESSFTFASRPGVLPCSVWPSLRVWCAFLSNSGPCFLIYFICSRSQSPRLRPGC